MWFYICVKTTIKQHCSNREHCWKWLLKAVNNRRGCQVKEGFMLAVAIDHATRQEVSPTALAQCPSLPAHVWVVPSSCQSLSSTVFISFGLEPVTVKRLHTLGALIWQIACWSVAPMFVCVCVELWSNSISHFLQPLRKVIIHPGVMFHVSSSIWKGHLREENAVF